MLVKASFTDQGGQMFGNKSGCGEQPTFAAMPFFSGERGALPLAKDPVDSPNPATFAV
jgi:hypothetical protein